MKAIFCLNCFDIRGLIVNKEVVCSCGNTRGRWYDPDRGLALVDGNNRDVVRVMGFHNSWLGAALDMTSHEGWRDLTSYYVRTARGYLFHENMRNCPVVIIRVGDTSDVTWMDNAAYFDRTTGVKQ